MARGYGYEPKRQDERNVDGTITSIARLDTWMATVNRWLNEGAKHGVYRQSEYGVTYAKMAVAVRSQLIENVMEIVDISVKASSESKIMARVVQKKWMQTWNLEAGDQGTDNIICNKNVYFWMKRDVLDIRGGRTCTLERMLQWTSYKRC